MTNAPTPKTLAAFTTLLVGSLAIAVLAFYAFRTLAPEDATYTLVFLGTTMLNQIHIFLAALFSWPLVRSQPNRRLATILGTLGVVTLLVFLLFYRWEVVAFSWFLFAYVVVVTFHIMRDFGYFWNQLGRGLRARPVSVSLFLTLGYLSVFTRFFTEPIRFFPTSSVIWLPDSVWQTLFIIFLLAGAVLGIVAFKKHSPLTALAVALALALVSISHRYFQAIDLFFWLYAFFLWHFILWYWFILKKISAGNNRAPMLLPRDAAELLAGLARRSRAGFASIATGLHVLILLPLVALVAAGFYQSITDAAVYSMFYGVAGYPFWGFMHIIQTALPLRRASTA